MTSCVRVNVRTHRGPATHTVQHTCTTHAGGHAPNMHYTHKHTRIHTPSVSHTHTSFTTYHAHTYADTNGQTRNCASSSQGKFISHGLWGISRHPNYFGEILCWLGLYVASSSVLRGAEHLSEHRFTLPVPPRTNTPKTKKFSANPSRSTILRNRNRLHLGWQTGVLL